MASTFTFNEDLARAYRALDPLVDAAEDEHYCARPEDPLAGLRARIELTSQPGLYAVAGHIGSGKTTELKRLTRFLSHKYIPCYKQVDLLLGKENLSEAEMMFFILACIIEVSESNLSLSLQISLEEWLESLHPSISEKFGKNLTKSILAWIQQVDFSDLGFSFQKKKQICEEASRYAREATANVINKLGIRPLVVLDGFDKVPLDQFEKLVPRLLEVSQFPVPIIITVPMSLLFTRTYADHRDVFHELAVVPAVRVMFKNGEVDEKGIDWFYNLLSTRGVTSLLPPAVKELARGSGGVIRSFLLNSREAIIQCMTHQRSVVDEDIAKDVNEAFKTEVARLLTEDDVRLLISVDATKRVIRTDSFFRLIDLGWVIEQRDKTSWYGVHPLIREVIHDFYPDFAEQDS